MGAWHQDRLADWPSVVTWLWLTHRVTGSVFFTLLPLLSLVPSEMRPQPSLSLYFFHFSPRDFLFCLWTELAHSSTTLFKTYRTICHQIPEGSNHHHHNDCHENLKLCGRDSCGSGERPVSSSCEHCKRAHEMWGIYWLTERLSTSQKELSSMKLVTFPFSSLYWSLLPLLLSGL
jgi:hypothetical protein